MNTQLTTTLPYIDTKKLLSGEISADNFIDLLHEYGFAYFYNLDFEPINLSSKVFKKIELRAKQFFNLSVNEKMKYYIGYSNNHRGYVPVTEKGMYSDEKTRVYEAFDMSYSSSVHSIDDYNKLRGDNIWPQEVTDFKETFSEYYNQMFIFGKELLRIFAKAFSLPIDYFDLRAKHPPAQLRLLHYLSNDSLIEQEDVAMGAHTDYECFTLLYQSSPGLQGFVNKNNEVVSLPFFKNSLLLVVGDMLHFMTRGYLKSFYHRVINNGVERYSFPFFMNLDFETEISVLPKFHLYDSKDSSIFSKLPEKIVIGHHLVGQLYRDFPYMKDKIDSGERPISFVIPKNNPFEYNQK